MALTLQQRAERAAIHRRIVEDQLAAKRAAFLVKAFTNENLKQTRKRKLGWTSPGRAERDLSNADRKKAMAMARQRMEESPIYAAICAARADHIVGKDYQLRMMTTDRGFNKEVESWWRWEKDLLDIRGMRTWGRLQRCLLVRHDVDADVGAVLVSDGKKGWVQIIEGDRIGRVKPENEADDGLVFDEYGMPVRFYVLDSVENPTSEKLYDRAEFIYWANDPTERANRRRGVCAYLQTFAIGQDHADTLDAMTQKVKNAAFIGLQFNVKGENPFGAAGDTATGENGVDYSRVRLVPGTNIVMRDGEDAKVLESATPNAEFLPWERTLITRMAWPVGMTYPLVTGDFTGLNYTVSRAMMNEVETRLAPKQNELAHISSRIFQWRLSIAVKAGEIKPPSGLDDYWRHGWGVPKPKYLNPMQEAQADALRIDKCLASRQSILAERNAGDFDDIADELKYEVEGLNERGVPMPQTPGSNAPQPLPQPQE